MSDIDKLVENYFAPKTKTLTKKMLYEIFEEMLLDESRNTIRADINEILFAYYAAGEEWNNIANATCVQESLNNRREDLGEEGFLIQDGRAKAMVEAALAWANTNGFDGLPRRVWWTARPNVLSRAVGQPVDSRKNPTDVLLQFEDESFLGISAKSTKSKGDIGFKNPGIGSLSQELGINLGGFVSNVEKETISKLNLPLSKKQRKIFIRQNPEIQKQTVEIGTQILTTLRDALYDHLQTLDEEDLRTHITDVWLDAGDLFPYYIKVTGRGNKKPYSATVEDPVNSPKLKAFAADSIRLIKLGGGSIGIIAGNKKIMKMRFKYESEKLASSLKLSGDPWAGEMAEV